MAKIFGAERTLPSPVLGPVERGFQVAAGLDPARGQDWRCYLLAVVAFNAVMTVEGGEQVLSLGPVASQLAIKQLGTNGSGFDNINSVHLFKNPYAWANIALIWALPAQAFAMPLMFGRMVGDRRQGRALFAVMGIILAGGVGGAHWAESAGNPMVEALRVATGAVNSMHASFTSISGLGAAAADASERDHTGRGRVGAVRGDRVHGARGGADVWSDAGVSRQEDRHCRDRLRTGARVLGLAGDRAPPTEQTRTIDAVLNQGAVVLERIGFATDVARVKALTQTERLRTALLSSVSHDLRTPLTRILGAASSLRRDGDRIGVPDRQALLNTIEDEARGLDRFVNNLLEMTRLEASAIAPRREWVVAQDAIEQALVAGRRLKGGPVVTRDFEGGLLPASADAVLLETLLINLF